MATDKRSREALLDENASLRCRLEEAEETLHAIYNGEVDALVISRPDDALVFTLKGAEYPYRRLVETMNEGAVFLTADGMIAYCNQQLSTLLQVPLETLIGSPLHAYVAPQDQDRFADRVGNLTHTGERDEIILETGAGNHLPVLFSCNAIELAGNLGVSIVVTDIRMRKQAEEQILRLNRLYAMLSAIGKTIAHCKRRDTLFSESCRIAVELGGFRLAWVGLLDPQTGSVAVQAAVGETGYLEGSWVTANDKPTGRGPTGTAIRAGSQCFYNDFLGLKQTDPWLEKARIHGLLASASVAIKEHDVTIGAFSLYAGAKDYFDDQQLNLLQQMGDDLSFALDNLAQESCLRKAEKQLKLANEREQIAQAIHDSEERLRLALDAARLGIYDWDLTAKQVIWSRRHEELFGFRPGEFSGCYEDFASRVHREDLPVVEAELTRSSTERTPYACEFRVIWPDRSVHWIMGLGKFTYDATGRPVRMRGTVEDITNRKQMADAVRETEALRITSRYSRRLIEASLDPLIIIDPKGLISDVNAAMEAVTGWPRETLIGTEFADYCTDPQHARAGYQQTFKNGLVRDYPLEIRHHNGHLTPVMLNAAVYQDDTGNSAGVFAAARDITEQMQLEEALRQSESKFRTMAEALPQIIWVTRADGWYLYFNQQWVAYTGLTLAESYGQGWLVPFHPDDHKRAWDAWQLATQTDSTYSLECRLRRVDGIYHWWLIRGVSLHDNNGKVTNWFGTCTDIQDIKEAEAKRLIAEKALTALNETLAQRVQEETEKNRQQEHLLIQQSRMAAMGEMIGNIAHQWRQPLNALTLVLANIEDAAKYQELTPEYLEQQTRSGERLIQKMSTTIDDFRHFFRPQKQMEAFSVAAAIEEALSLASVSLCNNNIELCLDMGDDIRIVGFANEFSQVLLNLLVNAKEAILARHPQGGVVTLRLSHDATHATLVVTDNGGGIPAAAMAHIFEPYFSTKELGTGIGLYMSKMIIETSMHGTIRVRNVDAGAEFSLSCPLDNSTKLTGALPCS
ncbi:PAS domain S-box protein [Methylobacter psychrophilus]|uniref:PAS domain S-box protein n=1 Tax=Methylobacter psychrophilus TaxID=96941 RepID=UPI0021D516C5|nr:PAS domain S-box protein [Methylobacter psychrophilus]